MPRGSRNARWPAILFLLTKEPRSVAELVKLANAHDMTVRYVLRQLEAEGLVKLGGVRPTKGRGRAPQVWKWIA